MGVRVIIADRENAGQAAEAYYRMFPREPSAQRSWDMEFEPGDIVRLDDISLLEVLRAMAVEPLPEVVLLVAHGTATGEHDGMVMPVGPGHRGGRPASATNEALQAIADCEGNPDTIRQVAERGLFVSEGTLEEILELRGRLRGQIERIELRACNLGKFGYVLGGIRDFFGTGAALAPRSFMLYGKVTPTISFQESSFEEWVDTNEGPAVSAVYEGSDAPAERLYQDTFLSTGICDVLPPAPSGIEGSLCVPVSGHDIGADTFFLKIWEVAQEPRHEWEITAAARTPEDIRPWIDANICANSGYDGGPFHVAAIWTYGALDCPYVLPLEQGYREMIACSP